MHICGKKKNMNDSDDGNSDDEESDVGKLDAYDGLVGTKLESQVRTVTPKSTDNDSFVSTSDVLSDAQSITQISVHVHRSNG